MPSAQIMFQYEVFSPYSYPWRSKLSIAESIFNLMERFNLKPCPGQESTDVGSLLNQFSYARYVLIKCVGAMLTSVLGIDGYACVILFGVIWVLDTAEYRRAPSRV